MFLLDNTLNFLKSFEQVEDHARVGLIKLTYIYFKKDIMYDRIKARYEEKKMEVPANCYIVTESTRTIAELVALVQQNGNPKHRMRATLYQIYHHAIHNRLREAKDIMMKSHISQ